MKVIVPAEIVVAGGPIFCFSNQHLNIQRAPRECAAPFLLRFRPAAKSAEVERLRDHHHA